MALTVTEVKNAKQAEVDYKLQDTLGLHLLVTKKGAKSWRFKYRFGARADGKGQIERRLTFGLYPDVSLAHARDQRDMARRFIREGKDPAAEFERIRNAANAPTGITFEEVAREWHDDESARWSPGQQKRIMERLQRDLFPTLGKRPIAGITGPEILVELRKIEARGSIETAKRVKGYVFEIFERAIGEHYLPGDDPKNPASKIGKALKPTPKGVKQPAITDLDGLLHLQKVVDGSSSTPATKLASRLLALTAVRIGVLRAATWDEFEGIDWADPDTPAPNATWRISAERMKLEVDDKGDAAYDHDVPLPPEAVAVLRALRLLTGRARYLFPSHKSVKLPMSDAALSTLYKRKGFRGKHVPHGWRSSFSTIMNERAVEMDRDGDRIAIDLMLAHVPRGISASEYAYNRSKHAKRRRELAKAWAKMITEGLPPPMLLVTGQER